MPDPRPAPPTEMRISDIETLRVLADPLRLRMLEVFGQHGREPLTVKEIARSLGEPLTKLYYHVNLLEQHGLIVVASSRLVSGIVEKHYRPAADRFEVDKSILASGPGLAHEAMRSVVASIFDATREDIEDAVHAGRARLSDEDEDGDDEREPVLLSKGLARLSHTDAVEFRQRLKDLYEEFGDRSDAGGRPDEGRHPFGLLLVLYPMADPPAPKRRLLLEAGQGVDPMTSPEATPVGVRTILRIADFRRIWAAQAISDLGDGLTNLTLFIVVLQLTGSTAAIALMAIAIAVPTIVIGPIAGVFVDRWDRRRVMLASDLLRAAIVLGFLLVRSADQLWLLYALAVAHSAVGTFFTPARMALVPRIVPEEGLLAANSLAQITRVIAGVLGASAAGLLAGFAQVTWPAFVVDASTFVVSFLLILGVRTSGKVAPAAAAAAKEAGVGRSLREGLVLVGRSRLLMGCMIGAGVTMLGLGAVNVLFVPFFVNVLAVPVTWLGVADIAQTSSMILAAGLTAAIASRLHPTRVIVVGLTGIGVCVGLLGASTVVWQVALLLFIVGWFVTPLEASLATILQTAVEDEQRGRVASTMHAVMASASVISMALAGVFGDIVGIRNAFFLAAGVVLLAALTAALIFRGVETRVRVERPARRRGLTRDGRRSRPDSGRSRGRVGRDGAGCRRPHPIEPRR